MSTVTQHHPSVDEVDKNVLNEQQSDVDFLCSMQRVTSLDDFINAEGDSWQKLMQGVIVTKPTPTHSSRRRNHLGPYWRSPAPSDENAASPFARRSLFSRQASPVMTSTPLRDIGNTTPKSSYRRCASDTAANDCGRLHPTPVTVRHSMSTDVLTADVDDERLVGDFSRPLCLPVVSDSKHSDLNSISSHTVRMDHTRCYA